MYTTSRVIEILDGKTVLVGCSTQACNGCKAQMFCNTKDNNTFTARNDHGFDLKVGDEVELYLPSGKTVASTALVFGLPLLLFPFGYLAVKHFFSFNELVNALGGIAAMGMAFAIAAVISTKNNRTLMPIINAKL